MNKLVTSTSGIVLLSPLTMLTAIQMIESNIPGWWWSISQKPAQLTISGGPQPTGPELYDAVFAASQIGDKGFVSPLFHSSHALEESVMTWVGHFFDIIKPHRQVFIDQVEKMTDDEKKAIKVSPDHRSQSYLALGHFSTVYTEFLGELEEIESSGWTLNEVYLGSCNLSIDCSLRGLKPDGSKFDISFDLQGNASTLANSLHDAIEELKNEIADYQPTPQPPVEI